MVSMRELMEPMEPMELVACSGYSGYMTSPDECGMNGAWEGGGGTRRLEVGGDAAIPKGRTGSGGGGPEEGVRRRGSGGGGREGGTLSGPESVLLLLRTVQYGSLIKYVQP